MENLAGNQNADKIIKEELYLAGIPIIKTDASKGEVPYSFIGKIGKWTFRRAWYYWITSVDKGEKGMILNSAMILYNKKHPTD